MQVMVHLRHPNITTIMGACPKSPEGDPPLLVMEYMQYGSLYEMLHNKMALLDGGMILRFAKDIATGMNYLHSCKPPILHNDLKTGVVHVLFPNAQGVSFGIIRRYNQASPTNQMHHIMRWFVIHFLASVYLIAVSAYSKSNAYSSSLSAHSKYPH